MENKTIDLANLPKNDWKVMTSIAPLMENRDLTVRFAVADGLRMPKLPTQTKGSIGIDLYACFNEDYIEIMPHECKLISTGVKCILPEGYGMIIKERGSTGSKNIKCNAGVIDQDFRGEIFVCIYNANNVPLYIQKQGDIPAPTRFIDKLRKLFGKKYNVVYPYTKAIAQGVLVPSYTVNTDFILQEDFNKYQTDRGEGMLGSSGK